VELAARGDWKHYGPTAACQDAEITIRPGRIGALVGENGAGKSTLAGILAGRVTPDRCDLAVDGRSVTIASPSDARRLGIGLVPQHSELVPRLTLLENLVLGIEPTRGPAVDYARARAKARNLMSDVGFELPLDRDASDLSVGERQKAEVLKLLYQDARCLLLDEPTALLGPSEAADLFAALRRLVDGGRSALVVTHRLSEVFSYCDDLTVMRRGRTLARRAVADTLPAQVAELMVGDLAKPAPGRRREFGPPALELRDVVCRDVMGVHRLDGFSLCVREGEIVGVAGVMGNGQEELVAVAAGVIPVEEGAVRMLGRDVTRWPTAARRSIGARFIPWDRQTDGLVAGFDVARNSILGRHRARSVCRGGGLSPALVRSAAEAVAVRGEVLPRDVTLPIEALSGGNRERLVTARELPDEARIVVAAGPGRGLDLRGIDQLERRLRALRDAGCAILLISYDLDELLRLADTVAVCVRGRVVAARPPSEYAPGELSRLMMTGAT
jgi:ABC-type uncharacterized transport system ATPase subunit